MRRRGRGHLPDTQAPGGCPGRRGRWRAEGGGPDGPTLQQLLQQRQVGIPPPRRLRSQQSESRRVSRSAAVFLCVCAATATARPASATTPSVWRPLTSVPTRTAGKTAPGSTRGARRPAVVGMRPTRRKCLLTRGDSRELLTVWLFSHFTVRQQRLLLQWLRLQVLGGRLSERPHGPGAQRQAIQV